jgi:hypothetical protein
MLSLEDFIISVFCLVDDHLKVVTQDQPLRSRGFEPSLTDSEVITMEIVGEFLSIDTDKGIWQYFRRHWLSFFPRIGSRTSFLRQAANLWAYKLEMQRQLAQELGAFDDDIHLVDGIPMPVCGFKRAHFSRIFRSTAAYGNCAAKAMTCYGFHGHMIVSFRGVITAFTMTAANCDEREALWEMLPGIVGLLIGDKGYISAPLKAELARRGIELETALRSNMADSRPPETIKLLNSTRRLIETVIGQLSERFKIEKVRARDLWHQTSRLARKLLSHTVCVFLNVVHGREPLQFDGLVSA